MQTDRIFPLRSFTPPVAIARVYDDNTDRITSIDIDNSGQYLVTTSQDESIHLYDCLNGSLKKTLYSKKYGCDYARFTHRHNNIIYASTKNDDTIRYLSMHDNRYLRYFKGHSQRVYELEMHPTDDLFSSCSEDGTMRLWDMNVSECVGLLKLAGEPHFAFDPHGLVFAVTMGGDLPIVKFFDYRKYEKGPFKSFPLAFGMALQVNSLRFSPNGSNVLINATEGCFVLNYHDGSLACRVTVPNGTDACFTPDSENLVIGSTDGSIYFWDIGQNEALPKTPVDDVEAASKIVLFNRKYKMMASAHTQLAFWIPE